MTPPTPISDALGPHNRQSGTAGPLVETDTAPVAMSRTVVSVTRRWRLGMDRFVDRVAG
jgi:hypothetical protein